MAWDPDEAGSSAYIKFGSYEQDNDLANGPEPIEWKILKQEEGRLLLMSRYGLDAKTYNETDEEVTWETCTLREWLNGAFFLEAFGEEEANLIEPSYVETADNSEAYPVTVGGNPTGDQLFLLSEEEVEEFLDGGRMVQPTEYAKAQSVYIGPNGNARVWLRSPGYEQNGAQIITEEGKIEKRGDYVSIIRHAVCPAMWVTVTDNIASQMEVGASNTEIGSTVVFGRYDYDRFAVGEEPLSWTVLDVKDGKMLLFCDVAVSTVTYSELDYLLGESGFINDAFSEEERAYIVLTKTRLSSADLYPDVKHGNTGERYAFVLNMEEVERYSGTMKEEIAVESWLSDYTIVTYGKRGESKEKTRFYLKEDGNIGSSSKITDWEERTDLDEATLHAVRPAMWVDTAVLQSGFTDKKEGEEQRLGSGHQVLTVSDEENNIVIFGRYEQDGDESNGAEPIEWLILDKIGEDTFVLISKYALANEIYYYDENLSFELSCYLSTTWDESLIRQWLNGTFYDAAFNGDEKRLIKETEVSVVRRNSDYTTTVQDYVQDYVYLLSKEEAENYFSEEYYERYGWSDGSGYAVPTPYLHKGKDPTRGWMTRDSMVMGSSTTFAAKYSAGSFSAPELIRPVIQVSVAE